MSYQDTTPIEYLSDYEFSFTPEELEQLDLELSNQEEQDMSELLKLQEQGKLEGNILKDILNAAKDGTISFLNSFTDTVDSVSDLKDSHSVQVLKGTEVQRNNNDPSTPKRTIREASKTPFEQGGMGSITGMSDAGIAKFESYKKAYSQRTKSITSMNKGTSPNMERLSGLRSYKVGPVVPYYSNEEITQSYSSKRAFKDNVDTSEWLRGKNFSKFDKALMKEFGFKTQEEATQWRKENHLTIHESPDGMYLVPTDVHDKVKHSGYCSKMKEHLEGTITDEQFRQWENDYRIQVVKHEMKNRTIRLGRGVALSVVKDLLKKAIFIIIEETYKEFCQQCEDKFIERVKRVCKQCFESIKNKCRDLLIEIKKNIQGSLVSELFTLLNDFIFKTAKNIFKIVRTMWSSIIQAFKVILSKGTSWQNKIFEAAKILSAGAVGVLGFSLNEIIEKGLTAIGLPFAGFISECLSGLFAGVMSAVVLVVFDNIKSSFKVKEDMIQQRLLSAKIIATENIRLNISSLKVDMAMVNTLMVVGSSIENIAKFHSNISFNMQKIAHVIVDIDEMTSTQNEANKDLADKLLTINK